MVDVASLVFIGQKSSPKDFRSVVAVYAFLFSDVGPRNPQREIQTKWSSYNCSSAARSFRKEARHLK